MVEKRKLLILDDDKSICDVLSQGLAKDYEVITTDDPDTAYRLVMKSPPSALLLDIHLKTGNGIDLCQKLRANPITRAIPILIFTGHGTPDKLTRSFDVGADDYIEKPIDLPQLRTRLAARIKRVQELHSQGIAFANL